MFTGPRDFENIVAPVIADRDVTCVAPCRELHEDGSIGRWRTDPDLITFNHTCQAFRKSLLLTIGGADENYRGYGREDNSFNWRYLQTGVRVVAAKDTVVHHQYHWIGRLDMSKWIKDEQFNIAYSRKEMKDITEGKRTVEANIGRLWGDIDS
jgi:hypothetical protein